MDNKFYFLGVRSQSETMFALRQQKQFKNIPNIQIGQFPKLVGGEIFETLEYFDSAKRIAQTSFVR